MKVIKSSSNTPKYRVYIWQFTYVHTPTMPLDDQTWDIVMYSGYNRFSVYAGNLYTE